MTGIRLTKRDRRDIAAVTRYLQVRGFAAGRVPTSRVIRWALRIMARRIRKA